MSVILWWVIVGLIAGWATGRVMKGKGFGPVMDIAVGIAGAIVGGLIMRLLGFGASGGLILTVLVAIMGAVLLTLILRFLREPPHSPTEGKASTLHESWAEIAT